jgi:hypothetical protein
MSMVLVKKAVFRPFSSFISLAACSILSSIPILNLLTWGYVLKAVRHVVPNGIPVLPDWDEPLRIIVNGIKGFLAVVLLLVPAFVTGWLMVLTTSGLLLPLSLMASVAFLYLAPATLVLLARTGSLSQSLIHCIPAAFTRAYLVAWLVAALIGIIIASVGVVFVVASSSIPLLRLFFAGVTAYILELVCLTITAQGIVTK